MKVKDLAQWLNEKYPEKSAEEWDNVGLLVGEDTQEISRIFLALDATMETIEQAEEFQADLLLTHHPMIFHGIQKINNQTDTGRKILRLIQNRMAYYAMHTNYDIWGMASHSAELLELRDTAVLAATEEGAGETVGFGKVGMLPEEMSLEEFGNYVRRCNQIPDVRIYGDPAKLLKRAAICTGSGKSFLREVLQSGADVYVTGDVDYHTALDALAEGLCLVDAGHYGTEYIFMDAMEKELNRAFPELTVGKAKICQPYRIV